MGSVQRGLRNLERANPCLGLAYFCPGDSALERGEEDEAATEQVPVCLAIQLEEMWSEGRSPTQQPYATHLLPGASSPGLRRQLLYALALQAGVD